MKYCMIDLSAVFYICHAVCFSLHGVLQTSRHAFEECNLSARFIRQWSKAQRGGVVTFTPELGVIYYFIDSVSGGCQTGRKLRV